LNDVGGPEPEEYPETLSSQSLAPLPEWMEEAEEETDALRGIPNSFGSFLTTDTILDFGLTMVLVGAVGIPFDCFLALFPARNSSKRRGRGRK
jgi:hypothetical protein